MGKIATFQNFSIKSNLKYWSSSPCFCFSISSNAYVNLVLSMHYDINIMQYIQGPEARNILRGGV